MRTYKALQPDELTLEKTDILAVKTRTSDGESQAFPTALWGGQEEGQVTNLSQGQVVQVVMGHSI